MGNNSQDPTAFDIQFDPQKHGSAPLTWSAHNTAPSFAYEFKKILTFWAPELNTAQILRITAEVEKLIEKAKNDIHTQI